jgi:hypothetical protein
VASWKIPDALSEVIVKLQVVKNQFKLGEVAEPLGGK